MCVYLCLVCVCVCVLFSHLPCSDIFDLTLSEVAIPEAEETSENGINPELAKVCVCVCVCVCVEVV